jgi:subtilisin family serine protease/outer membrane protein assembly factor BamB
MRRWACAAAALVATAALWGPTTSGAAAAAPAATHHATLGPLAEAALSASAHGRHLPAAWLVGRSTKQGTVYGVFIRGTTTARAIAATGAVPGTVLSVGATADATLPQLHALEALAGVTEVELAGQAKPQLDLSVPAIHASEPGHASAAGVPHLWSGTGGSPETETGGGTSVWNVPTTFCEGVGETPVLFAGKLYDYTGSGLETLDAATGAEVGSINNNAQPPAFDGTTEFYVDAWVLTAQASNGTILWRWPIPVVPSNVSPPIVVNHNLFIAVGDQVYAMPAAGNGTSTNAPTWTGTITGSNFNLTLTAGDGYLIVNGGDELTAFGDTTVTPSADNATAYQIDAGHDGDQPNDSMTAPLDSTPKWTVNLPGETSYPLIANGVVYVDADSGTTAKNSLLYAFNAVDGSTLWGSINAGGGQDDGSTNYGIAYDNGRIFSVNSNGGVAAFNAATGAALWFDQLNTAHGEPVAVNGVVYTGGSTDSNPSFTSADAIGESSGVILWTSQTADGSDFSAPTVSSTGVYVSTDCYLAEDLSVGQVTAAAAPTFAGDTGKGTIVGVVDTGIDLSNQDFMTSNGTRILDLWDQPACPNPQGNGFNQSCPAQQANAGGFTYGAECTQSMINGGGCGVQPPNGCCGTHFTYGATCEQPIQPNQPTSLFPEEDCDGHGTHVAGIAASNGRAAPAGTYIGVAPEADLVIVKDDGDLANVIDGVAYIFAVAAAKGEPASVNISLGTNEGPHDGSDMFETMLDALTGPGRLISVAGGNEATNNPTYHYHASASAAHDVIRTDGLLVESMPVFIDLWYPGADSMSAAITESGYGATPWVSPDTTGVSGEDGTCVQGVPGKDVFIDPSGNDVEILSCTHMPSNGMNEIQIGMFNYNNSDGNGLEFPSGVPCDDSGNPCLNDFKLLLRDNSSASATYNAWTVDQGDYFFYLGDGNDRSTLDEPASAHDVISVGSDVTRNSWPSESGTETDSSTIGAISNFSGEGPTLDGRTGIDIVAPGEEIGSSLSSAASTAITTACPAGTTAGCTSPDGNHLFLQGTSMASPHVAGALALLLAQQPTIDPAEAKSLLAQSADTSPLTSGGAATTWGAGKLLLGPGALSISPAQGPLAGGGTIDITGVDLQSGITMSLGGHALTLTSIGPNEWSAPAPAVTQSGSVSLTMTNPDGSTAVDPAAYLYIDPTAYHTLTPFRICDTRSTSSTAQCKGKTLGSRGVVTVQITGGSIPSTAEAVVVNLTAVNHSTTATYVTAYPAGGSVPLASNLNLGGPGAQANLVIVQLNSSGQLSIYNAVGVVDVIVDVQGYFAKASGSGTVPGEFHSMPPLRICDTRAGGDTECAGSVDEALAAGTWRDIVLSGLPPGAPGGTPSIPSDGTAAAAVFNLTATQGTAATYLTVVPPNSSDACPTTSPSESNVNPPPETNLPNRVISPLGPRHDVCVYNAVGSIEFIIDVDGWFGTGAETSTGALFYSIAPTRICDTRAGSTTECAGKALMPHAANVIGVAGLGEVPSITGVTPPVAVVANLTAIAGSAATYFTLYPSDVTRPHTSDLNPVAGQIIANLSIVGIAQTAPSAGDVSLYNAAGTINAILDVAGWFQ